ncbi:MAG: transposase, partial [bacterium]
MNKPSTPNTKPFPRRKRLRLPEFDYSQPGYAYFLTLGVKSSRPLFRHNKFAAQVISILLEERSRHRVNIFTYCLVPDHLHVVLSSKEGGKDIPSLIRNFKRLTTR